MLNSETRFAFTPTLKLPVDSTYKFEKQQGMCLNGKAGDIRGTNTVLSSFSGKNQKVVCYSNKVPQI